MEMLFRYLLLKYGDQVLTWTIHQVMERLAADGVEGCGTDTCDRVRQLQKQGFELDPDCGVYFWELPAREQ